MGRRESVLFSSFDSSDVLELSHGAFTNAITMKRLELYFPAKPFTITQPWGVKNDAYLRFGFSKHNGVDFLVDKDGIVRAMCKGTVVAKGYKPEGAGIFVTYRSELAEIGGVECYADFCFMHAKEILCDIGDKLDIGTPLMIANNTGFSTGPHTHVSGMRISKTGLRLDEDDEASNTFDIVPYFNGKFADDYPPELPFNFNMYIGDENKEVERLQKVLQNLGFFPATIKPTGYYGLITKKAVYQFQLKYVALDWWSKLQVSFNGGDMVLSLTRRALNKLL